MLLTGGKANRKSRSSAVSENHKEQKKLLFAWGQRQYDQGRSGGRRSHDAANPVSGHLWLCQRVTMVTKLQQNESVLKVKNNSDGPSRGLGAEKRCAQCQQ
ncbi:hypothetical protein Q8A73_021017 [Channa argus]|nr:hypothetical protein Q8A73_021017 [Channa argus]